MGLLGVRFKVCFSFCVKSHLIFDFVDNVNAMMLSFDGDSSSFVFNYGSAIGGGSDRYMYVLPFLLLSYIAFADKEKEIGKYGLKKKILKKGDEYETPLMAMKLKDF